MTVRFVVRSGARAPAATFAQKPNVDGRGRSHHDQSDHNPVGPHHDGRLGNQHTQGSLSLKRLRARDVVVVPLKI